MASQWQPFREPLGVTLLRNGIIAVVLGAVLAGFWGGMRRWPIAVVVVLWPTLGGHLVEVWFLNLLRPLLPAARGVQAAARVGVWFVGGIGLAFCMRLTAKALTGLRPGRWPAWWVAGLAFIGIELVAHLALQLRGRPNFYNGLG
jgi:hypothetical protein